MRCAIALLIAAIFFSGCAHKKKKHVKAIPPPAPMKSVSPGYTEAGIASWYGHPYHGRPAADGEIYDMEQMVAAHRTLPFDTWVRVYDLDNHKSVEVRIIDRGPFVDGRIIDLSHAAANAINMVGPGTAHVRMVVIVAPAGVPTPVYVVQVGAFGDRAVAERIRMQMAEKYGPARILERQEN